MKTLFVVFFAILSVAMPMPIFAEETILTPSDLIKTLEIIDLGPERDENNERVWAVFASMNLYPRKVVIENGASDYFGGIKIITLPVPKEEELNAWSLISYEVLVPGEQLNVWRNAKYPKFRNTKQHIWFVFKINVLVPTNELISFIKEYQAHPVRTYDGLVHYRIFKVRKDIRTIPIEDFEQGAETLYIEIDMDITKIDGKKLKIP